MSKEILDKIREVISEHMQEIVTKGPNAVKDPMAQYAITQCYLQFQILDRLEDINWKIAVMNINIQDVEQAILAQEDRSKNE